MAWRAALGEELEEGLVAARAGGQPADEGAEHYVCVRTERGGFSRRLNMPEFSGWQDLIMNMGGRMRVLVPDRTWSNTAGVNNQERWVEYAIERKRGSVLRD